MGDFNINWCKPSTPRNILQCSLCSCGLERIPFQPTHHNGAEPSTIDYICVSDLKSVVAYEQQHIPHISKHDVLFAAIALEAPKHVPQPITCRLFRHFNAENFQRDLACINWQGVLDFTSVDAKVEFLSSNILRLYDTHAPYHTFTPKKKPSPRLNSAVKSLINARNKAWAKFKRTRRANDREAYKHLRNRVKVSIRNAIAAHYNNRLHSCKNSTELWSCISELGIGSRVRSSFSLPVDVNELNKFFVGDSNPNPIRDHPLIDTIPLDDQFYFSHVPAEKVVEAILSARSNAKGPDDIPVKFLKDCYSTTILLVLLIFDCSLQPGVFPSAAIVRPLLKRWPPTKAGDFRPLAFYVQDRKF